MSGLGPDDVFSRALSKVNGIYLEKASAAAETTRKKIEKGVRDRAALFYQDVFSNVSRIQAGTYPPFSKRYYAKKRRLSPGTENQFYYFSGTLREEMLARDANRDFGSPTVRMAVKGKGLKEEFGINTFGQVYNKASGAWAKLSDAFVGPITYTFVVEVFPEVTDRTRASIFRAFPNQSRWVGFAYVKQGEKNYNEATDERAVGQYRYRAAGLRTKLMRAEFGGKGQKARPLLGPSIVFFRETVIPKHLRNLSKEMK